jgi:hypothetical protein
MFTFVINLYCPKAYHRPDHLICITEYHGKLSSSSSLNPTPSPRLEPRTAFQVCDLSSCNLLTETNNFVLCAVLLLCLVSELQKPSSLGITSRTVFLGLWHLFLQSPCRNKQLWSLRCTSIMLSFQATGTALTRN